MNPFNQAINNFWIPIIGHNYFGKNGNYCPAYFIFFIEGAVDTIENQFA